jgi:UDP-N-acetylmuramoylalanine--D-glutamate ligase
VLVLGLARSGKAAAAALERRGVEVVVADRTLGNDGGLGLLDGIELMVKSPGVPREAPLVVEAEQRGVEIWSEVELGYRLLRPRLVGVTGTNGKTTTTELLGAILRAPTAGNVGRALTGLDGEVEPGALVVCELSSFQLEDVHELACEVAVLLNLEPDHLDRYASFDDYRDAKLRIFERARAKIVPKGSGLDGIEFAADDELPAEPLIRGAHNRENAAAATAAARALGTPDECGSSTTRRRRTSLPPCAPWPPTRTSRCT